MIPLTPLEISFSDEVSEAEGGRDPAGFVGADGCIINARNQNQKTHEADKSRETGKESRPWDPPKS